MLQVWGDILESYVASIVSAIVLCYFHEVCRPRNYDRDPVLWADIASVLIAGAGVLSSLIGVLVVANLKSKDARKSLSFGNLFTGGLVLASVAIVIGIAAPDYPFKDAF